MFIINRSIEVEMNMKHTYKLNRNEITFFCENIAMMIKSGITISNAIEIMLDDLKESNLKEVLISLHIQVDTNYSLSNGLYKTMSFPKYMIDMVSIGETTGKVDEVLESLADYYQKENEMIGRIKTAVLYPTIMTVLMSVIIFFLVYSVLPIFNKVFLQLGDSISPSSTKSIDSGFLIGQVASYIIIVVLLLIFVIFIIAKFSNGKYLLYAMLQKTPFISQLLYQIAVSKFAYALSIFLSSGLDIDKSMSLSIELIDNKKLRHKLQECVKLLEQGSSFPETLSKQDIFGAIYGGMFKNSMVSGNQENIIKKIAGLYEKMTIDNIDIIISMVVPVSITVMTLMVGVVLISVMLPLIGIMSSIA